MEQELLRVLLGRAVVRCAHAARNARGETQAALNMVV